MRNATARFRQIDQTFADNAAEALLRRNQLDSAEATFARCTATHLRHSGRGVCELVLDAGTEPVRIFVKLNWDRQRLWPRMTDLRTGQVFQTLPEREWCGLGTLAHLGLHVPERLALFRSGWLNFQAAVLLRAVPPPHSLDSLLSSRAWWAVAADDRRTILAELAACLRTIHEAGYAWRGACSRHFFPERKSDGGWRLWLIDCEGVHRLTSRRAIARDNLKLLASMRESGADDATLAQLQQLVAAPRNWRCAA